MIDIDKFIVSLLHQRRFLSDNENGYIIAALKEQGLEFRDGSIAPVSFELAESEDEKIKKRIIHFIKENSHLYGCSGDEEPAIAWLEKQGEQKSVNKIEPKFKIGDKVCAIRNRFECTIEKIDDFTYYGDTTNFDIKDQEEWKLVERKPVRLTYDENGEPELSEFEADLFTAVSDLWQSYMFGEELNIAYWAREHSAELIESATKQKPVE